MVRDFEVRSTADQVLAGIDLGGKQAIVTGGNSGIGAETVRALAAAGANVVLTARSPKAGEKVAADIKASGVKGTVSVQQMDLSDLASVRASAEALQGLDRIDMIILNAGVMTPPLSYTRDNYELQIGTNHFGHFALVTALLPKLKAQDFKSRVVAVSSVGHNFQRGPLNFDDLHYRQRKYSSFGAYGQSKVANILFAKELAKRLEGTNVSAFALHPGGINTNLQRHLGPLLKWIGWLVMTLALYLPFGDIKTVPQGAATSVYAATAPELEGHSGAYLVDCHIKTPSKVAQDPEQAAKLWAVTEEQIAAAAAPGGFKG